MDERKLSQYIDDLNAGKRPREHKNGLQEEEKEDEILLATVRKVRQLKEIEFPDDSFQGRLMNSLAGREKSKRNRIRKYGLICTSAAAAILLFVTAYYFLPNRDAGIVYAMENAMKEIRAYHGIIEVSETNGLGETITQSKREVWADKKGNYYIVDLEGTSKGTITANNGQQKWQLRPEEKAFYLLPIFPDAFRFTFELGNEINNASKAQTVKIAGLETVNGRQATKLQITPKGGESYFLWVDDETDLPLQRISAMQNGIQIKAEYTSMEFMDEIPRDLLVFDTPDGYKEIDTNTEQEVASLEEAERMAGFMPKLMDQAAKGYTLDRIAVEKDHAAVKLYYSAGDTANTILLIQSETTEELVPSSAAILGTVDHNKAEIITTEPARSVRWQEDGMEYCILGSAPLETLTVFAEDLSHGKVVIPVTAENAGEPRIKVEVDQSVGENEQKSVDAGHSPWKLDPVFVSQVFASLLLSPEGIVGDYPIAYENIKITFNNGVDAVAEIKDEKSVAKSVYLKRLVRQDDTGIWTVVGYDPAGQ
ncbi:LolA family protein [Lacrimispora brassicae]